MGDATAWPSHGRDSCLIREKPLKYEYSEMYLDICPLVVSFWKLADGRWILNDKL